MDESDETADDISWVYFTESSSDKRSTRLVAAVFWRRLHPLGESPILTPSEIGRQEGWTSVVGYGRYAVRYDAGRSLINCLAPDVALPPGT